MSRRTGRAARLVTAALVLVVAGTLGAAGLLAVLRLTDTTHRRTIELAALTPLGLPLAVIGLLAAVLLALRRRRSGLLAALMCLALAGLHGWWLAPSYVATAPAAAEGPRLVVLSQNLEAGDAGAVVGLVERKHVDVLVITDAAPERVGALRAAGVGRSLPHSTAAEGGGTVVWSHFPITGTTLVPGGGSTRLVTLDVTGLGAVDVLALHPSPPYRAGGDDWTGEWHRILDWLGGQREVRGPRPLLAAGDLNATGDHWPLRRLADLGLTDAAAQCGAGRQPTWPADGPRRLGLRVPPLLALDHVLTGPGLVATRVEVRDEAGGDHLGVLAVLAPAG